MDHTTTTKTKEPRQDVVIVPPAPKRIKVLDDTQSHDMAIDFLACSKLLSMTSSITESLVSTVGGPTGNNLEKVRTLFDHYGFRTSVITSPRPALSIYKDSCILSQENKQQQQELYDGKEFLLIMLGMHPHQNSMKQCYTSSFKHIYCFLVFCQRIRQLCPTLTENKDAGEEKIRVVNAYMVEFEQLCNSLANKLQQQLQDGDGDTSPTTVSTTLESPPSSSISNEDNSSIVERVILEMNQLSESISERVAHLISLVVQVDSGIRVEQLEREYDRLTLWNSTLANAYLQRFLQAHRCCIKDIYFKKSHLAKYERITIYLYDPELDMVKPPQFTFVPCLRRLVDDGADFVVQDMVASFWNSMLRHGYFATQVLQQEISPCLENYFRSGIVQDPNIPVLLNAHFTPTYPLSFYLYGKAGSGKSSLVRNFSPALNETIERHVDPEIMVRFVKQNLNKPQCDLELELELRPNNNDLSVMSIIQGRRMSMTQSKPGLVIIDLEEMASNIPNANPNQLETCQLISQRFSGRKSTFKASADGGARAPRNSTKRGISGDATLVPLFTSNYVLELPCREALARLEMFHNLKCLHMTAVHGTDRADFAQCYLKQCIQDQYPTIAVTEITANLSIPLGQGDTRPLVRHLRMIAFYICALQKAKSTTPTSSIYATVIQDACSHSCTVRVGNDQSIDLKVGTMENLFPIVPQVFDDRVEKAMHEITTSSSGLVSTSELSELSQIIDFYFARTLAPAVVVSSDALLIKNLVQAIGSQHKVHSIRGVEAGTYKMMKSLYDPSDTPNLRDDILKFGKGSSVAVELQCSTVDGQLCIREIIEDSPSMTAFSTNKSALYKSGLFFAVHVTGELTPEVRSRASIVI